MRRFLLSLLLFFAASPASAGEVAVSILPLQAWASEMLADEVQVLVGPGQSPDFYEPTARQLTALSETKMLFSIGVPFEKVLLPRVRGMFPDLEVVELGAGIQRLDMPGTDGHVHDLDPHVWIDPTLAPGLILEMEDALVRLHPDREEALRRRGRALRDRQVELDARLRARLEPLAGQAILAYHPALGYFARAYGLRQISVESKGNEPGGRHLTWISQQMEGQALRVLVIEPQFAPQRARSVAGTLGLDVIVFDPLSTDLVDELDRFTLALVAAAGPGKKP